MKYVSDTNVTMNGLYYDGNKMTTLIYTIADGISTDILKSDILVKKPKKIIIFNECEWEYKQVTPEVGTLIKENNIDLKIVMGSFDGEFYDEFCDRTGLTKENLIFWSTYWINWTEMCLKNEMDHYNHVVSTDFKYPFICLNNKNSIHREALIDHLAKYNLIDRGVVTWHKFMNMYNGYKFNYYDNSTRTIDDDFSTKQDSFIIPKQWHESFLHVVGESTVHAHFITEKTIIPMLLKKPLVTISRQGFNKKLLELGFKLYDEIIDYSYDDKESLIDRADILCKSIANMPTNYSQLYELLRPKIEYNYYRCLEIIHSKKYIPNIIFERVEQLEKNPTLHRDFTDSRNVTIVKKCHD